MFSSHVQNINLIIRERERRRLAQKKHKKEEQMLKEKLMNAKKKEDEIKLAGAVEQKKIQVQFLFKYQ